MKRNRMTLLNKALLGILSCLILSTAQAGIPLWIFEPLTSTTIALPANSSAVVQYRVTNQSNRTHTLVMQPIQGVTQITTGLGLCNDLFVLRSKGSCILSLGVNGGQLSHPIADGPVVCQQPGIPNQCYRPGRDNILHITQAPPITDAVITVTGSPLILTVNGPTGQLTVNNTSTEVAVTNITSNFTGTALDGNVTETGNTCANVPPGGSCTLTYTPGNSVVPQTDVNIQGSNTNAAPAAIAIQSGSTLTAVNPNSGVVAGGTGVTLTGTGLTGATAVMFGGVAATSVNVVSSTTVTAVTPAHAIGIVDVVINTPAGGATLTNGYTYVANAIGLPSGGGVIACMNGGLNDLIAATADNSSGIEWGGLGTAIGAGAQSITNGATNTIATVTALGNNGGVPYAAQLCSNFQVDSQGNTPCQAGNTCYSDWFLPSGNNLTASGQQQCLYLNRVAIGGFNFTDNYWSSSEDAGDPANFAYLQGFDVVGNQGTGDKAFIALVRCVRSFTP